eukprot:3132812-Pleurochrysis_carterae.AAC.1
MAVTCASSVRGRIARINAQPVARPGPSSGGHWQTDLVVQGTATHLCLRPRGGSSRNQRMPCALERPFSVRRVGLVQGTRVLDPARWTH